jgi:hypothetical protein
VAEAVPEVAEPMIGESATVAGVTGFDAPDSALSPTALVACTVKV